MSKSKEVNPYLEVEAWNQRVLYTRMHDCVMLLTLQGFLRDSEAAKVKERIKKWKADWDREQKNARA